MELIEQNKLMRDALTDISGGRVNPPSVARRALAAIGPIDAPVAEADERAGFVKEQIALLAKWLPCMSYNDSYFGEPAGLVKKVVRQLEKAVDSAALVAKPVTEADERVLYENSMRRNGMSEFDLRKDIEDGKYSGYDAATGWKVWKIARAALVAKPAETTTYRPAGYDAAEEPSQAFAYANRLVDAHLKAAVTKPAEAICSGCDPAEGFCRYCRETENKIRAALPEPQPAQDSVDTQEFRNLLGQLLQSWGEENGEYSATRPKFIAHIHAWHAAKLAEARHIAIRKCNIEQANEREIALNISLKLRDRAEKAEAELAKKHEDYALACQEVRMLKGDAETKKFLAYHAAQPAPQAGQVPVLAQYRSPEEKDWFDIPFEHYDEAKTNGYEVRYLYAAPPASAAQTDPIVELNIALLRKRSAVGIAKYGTTLADNPLELAQWLNHALEESLDQANYLQAAIQKLNKNENK